jgi:hypothetical protein
MLTFILLFGITAGAAAERIPVGYGGGDVSVAVQQSNSDRIVVRYDIGAFEKNAIDVNGETYFSIGCGKESILLNAGEPAVPRICRSVIIPDNAEMKISVLSSEYIDFPATPVVPSKGNLLRTVNPADVPYSFGSTYALKQQYPSDLASIREPYIMRDYRGTVIEVYPFQYLPQTQTLRVYTSVTVELVNVGQSSINVLHRDRTIEPLVAEFDLTYQRQFINYDQESKLYVPVQESGDMLIISYGTYSATMQPLVDWKRQKGIKTTLVNVSTIGTTSTQIKAFIQSFYDTTDLAWVLLIGDAAQIATPSASGGSSDPSYAKVAGSDSYPDIFVGRFSAESVADVQTQVQRTITYERDSPGIDWFHKATGVASDQGPGHGNNEYDYQHMNLIRTDLLASTFTVVDQIYDPGATSAQVATALNNGRSFANYTGHGSTNAWSTSGFSNTNVNALTNTNMLPLVYSVACVNGQFDGYTCFAEAWLRARNGGNPTGAIAAYMSSINQSWDPPMDAQDEATDLFVAGTMTTVGGICYNSSCKMIDLNGSGGVSMYDTWHIFGDPSVQVRRTDPVAMTVNHTGAVFFNAATYPVEVVGTPKALCALYYNGVLYGSGYTLSNGICNIPINQTLPFGITLTLTVTAFNKQTYVGSVAVASDLAIVHTPLVDTKNAVTPYEVKCVIYTSSALVADSALLRYNTGADWYVATLTETTPAGNYVGYIPAQTPGTQISYYLFATNIGGFRDSTDLATFRVIDYALVLAPAQQVTTAAVGDTVWFPLTVTNDGVLTDQYNIGVTGSLWGAAAWNQSGTAPISSIGPLAMDASASFKVRVIVPSSATGANDLAQIKLTSSGNPAIFREATTQVYSAGQPLSIPFFDGFATLQLDTVRWDKIAGAAVSSKGLNPPSAPYVLNLDGSPSGADTLVSDKINLRNLSGINITYYYEKKGSGDTPEAGDDLFVEYLNEAGNWVLLRQHLGSGSDMSSFEPVTIGVPADGYHAAFRLRFRNIATVGAYDDWLVDNVRIDYGPAIAVSSSSLTMDLAQGDSAYDNLIISNSGLGALNYSLVTIPDLSPTMRLFDQLMQEKRVNPATYAIPDGGNADQEIKGEATTFRGPDIAFNAGGPDAFGYVWIDSDEPGGPTFGWVDIEATGTNITSGLTDDNFIGPYQIGFNFPYYDSTYTEFWVSSNGFIGFGPTAGYSLLGNTALPSTATPNNIIAWCWDDLNILNTSTPGGKVLYQNVGGNLVIQYEKFPRLSAPAGGVITAQVILYPDGNIKIQYETIGAGFDLTTNTIGMENKLGTTGLQVAYNTTYLHNALAIQFTKPAQWLFASPAAGDVPSGAADTISLKFVTSGLDLGLYKSVLKVYSNDPDANDNPLSIPARLTVLVPYQCGDASGDDVVNISDAVFLVDYIFAGGPTPVPIQRGDCNCDGIANITDATYLLAYIFGGGPAPCSACK